MTTLKPLSSFMRDKSALNAIGNTPLVKMGCRILGHLNLPQTANLYAKCENLNIGGSKKDRVAKQMILEARANGDLSEGQSVVELTSGNTGTGLAIVSAALNHKFIAVMSEGNSVERARMMKACGAEVVLVPQAFGSTPGQVSGEDLKLVEDKTLRLVKERGAFRADQFRLPGSWRCHYENTGPEIWEACGGELGGFVDFVGSGGTIVGCSKFFKEVGGGKFKCFAVEPKGKEVLGPRSGEREGGHRIQGGGYEKGYEELELFQGVGMDVDKLIDGHVSVSDEEAIEAARLLASKEGILGGFSAGANLAAAATVLREGMVEEGQGVAFVVCDSAMKYLSTDLFEG